MHELQERVETQLEGDDRANAGGTDRITDANQLGLVEPGWLLEDEVLSSLCRENRLLGVEVIRRCDGNDIDVVRFQQILIAGRQARVRQGNLVLVERGLRPGAIATVEPGHTNVWALLECGDVLGGTPANARYAYAKFSITSRHWLSLD